MRVLQSLLVLTSLSLLSCLAPGEDGEGYDDDLDAGTEAAGDVSVVRSLEQALVTNLCGNMAGLQAGAASPMRGGCPSHASQSSLHGPTSATLNWTHDFLWDVRTAPAVAENGEIYIGSDDGNFYAINPATGATLWKVFLWNQIKSSPAIADDSTIYVGSNANKVHAINPMTRAEKYTAFDTYGDVTASPVIGPDGVVYIGSQTGKFYALNANLTKKWEYPTIGTVGAIRTSAAIGPEGTIYFAADDNKLYALNPDKSQKFAPVSLGVTGNDSSPTIANNAVYIGSNANKLHAFDAQTGVLLWERTLGSGGTRVGSPAVDKNGVVYIGGGDFKLHAFTPQGDELWAYSTLGAITAAPVIDIAGNLYFGSEDDSLYAVDAGGNLIWKYPTWNNINGPAVIGANGAVLFGGDDNLLHSVGVAGPAPRMAGETCSADKECAHGLICGEDNGDRFGFTAGTRVCWEPSCQNGVKDFGEQKLDCGGACGSCENLCVGPCVLGTQVTPAAADSLDFEAGNFIRGSLATFNKQGQAIERAGAHQLRYVSSPDGRRMALFEGTRTNTVIRSEELNTMPGWFVPDFLIGAPVQLVVDAGAAPDGTTSADQLVAPAGGIPATIQLAGPPTGSGTLSAYVKNTGAPGSKTRMVLVDAIVSGLYSTPDAWDLPTNWTRFDKASIATTLPMYVAASHVANWPAGLGDLIPALPAASYYLWGIQWESGNFPSSYLPTNDQPRKRNADQLTFTQAQVPTWMRNGIWQFDFMPEYASADLTNGEQFTLFSFGGSDDVIVISKQGSVAHLQARVDGVVKYDVELSWSRNQVISVTVDAPVGELIIRGATIDAHGTPHPFTFPASALRVGGVVNGGLEAFAALTEPRQVPSATVACVPDPSCITCGDGQVSGTEECDPAADPRCDSNCSETGELTIWDDAASAVCPVGQSIPASPNGIAFGAGYDRFVCVPTQICSGASPQCGTAGAPCGECACVPDCSNKQCGDDLNDGCGGICMGVCGAREPGCTQDSDCPTNYVCGIGVTERLCGNVTLGVNACIPAFCDDYDPGRPQCGSCGDPCGTCDAEATACGMGALCQKGRSTCPSGEHENEIGVCVSDVNALADDVLTGEVGALPGSFAVSPTGEAGYAVPIAVPPGRNQFAPDLTLNYASSGTNGMVGFGWSVQGLSAISLCSATLARDGTLTDGDVGLCLDGTRIVPVKYDANSDTTEWRTEVESFFKITSAGNSFARIGIGIASPLMFTVLSKSGVVSIYGATEDERVYIADPNPSVIAGYRARDGYHKVRSWLISKTTDRHGNSISYKYSKYQKIQAGVRVDVEVLPRWIGYNFGSQSPNAEDAQSEIVFRYAGENGKTRAKISGPCNEPQLPAVERPECDRQDALTGYVMGVPIAQTHLLKHIDVRAGGELIRSYKINHKTSANGLSMVRSVVECGYNKAGADTCRPPTIFEYNEFETALGTRVSAPTGAWTSEWVALDFNNDGYDDAATFRDGKWEIFLGGVNGLSSAADFTHTPSVLAPPVTLTVNGRTVNPHFVTDFDGDGRTDLVYQAIMAGKLYLTKISYDALVGMYDGGFTMPWGSTTPGKNANLVPFDADGDKFTDILHCSGDSRPWQFFRNEGGNLQEPVTLWGTSGLCDNMTRTRMPDGREAIIFASGEIFNMLGMAHNDLIHYVQVEGIAEPANQYRLVGNFDVNGDGLQDLLLSKLDTRGQYVWYINVGGSDAHLSTEFKRGTHGYSSDLDNADSVRSVDFDLDGRSDILLSRAYQSTVLWYVHRRGDLSNLLPVPIASLAGQSAPDVLMLDVNGDGRQDYLGPNSLFFGQSPLANLLKTVSVWSHGSSIPDRIDVDYASGVATGVYTQGSLGIDCDSRISEDGEAGCVQNLPFPVVAAYTRSSFLQDSSLVPAVVTQSSSQQFSYWNAVADRHGGLGYLGFQTRAYTSQGVEGIESSTTVETYRQDAVHEGKAGPFAARNYALTQPGSSYDYYYYPFTHIPNFTSTTWQIAGNELTRDTTVHGKRVEQTTLASRLSDAGCHFTVPLGVRSYAEEEYGRVNDVSASFTYDEYGNLKTEETRWLQEAGYVERKGYAYTHEDNDADIAAWRVGLVSFVGEESESPHDTSYALTMLEYTAQGVLEAVSEAGIAGQFRLKTEFGRDDWGNVNLITETPVHGNDPARVTSLFYDPNGVFVQEQQNAEGHVEVTSYSYSDGQIRSRTDANGFVITWKYDVFGRPTEEFRGDLNLTTTFEYAPAAAGLMTPVRENAVALTTKTTSSLLSPDTIVEKSWSDSQGRTVATEVPGFGGARIRQSKEYDLFGRESKVTRPQATSLSQGVIETSYDGLGRVVRVDFPDNTSVETFYASSSTIRDELAGLYLSEQSARWITVHKNQSGITSGQVHDARGNQVLSIDGADEVTRFAYGSNHFVYEITDPVGNKTTRTQDNMRRLTHATDPDTGNHSYQYNAWNEVEKHTHNTVEHTFGYDRLGRRTSLTNTDGVTTWEYDEVVGQLGPRKGALVRETSPNGHVSALQYTATGKALEVMTNTVVAPSGPVSLSTSYEYDDFGRPEIVHYPESRLSVKYSYGPEGMVRRAENALDSQEVFWQLNTAYEGFRPNSVTFGDGATLTLGYNQYTGRIESRQVAPAAGALLINEQLHWNAVGSLESLRKFHDAGETVATVYQYDNLQRLTGSTAGVGGPSLSSYTYTATGNIKTKSGAGTFTYGVGGENDNGPQTLPHAVRSTDENGDLHHYTYDAFGRMETRSGATVPGGTQTFGYNALGKLETVRAGSDPNAPVTKFEYGASQQRVLRLDPDGVETIFLGPAFERTDDGSSIEDVVRVLVAGSAVAELRFTDGVRNETAYLHANHIGTPDLITFADGTVKDRVVLGNFGEGDTTATASSLGYTGHRREVGIGLTDMGARFYDPRIGRFVSPDPTVPSAFSGQSYNRYSYADNNPVTWTDPSGLATEDKRQQDGLTCGGPCVIGAAAAAVVIFAFWVSSGAASGEWTLKDQWRNFKDLKWEKANPANWNWSKLWPGNWGKDKNHDSGGKEKPARGSVVSQGLSGGIPLAGAGSNGTVPPRGPATSPPGKQPWNLWNGNQAHRAIAAVYLLEHPTETVFANSVSMQSIASLLGGNPAAAPYLLIRPDIYNATTGDVYEIKSATTGVIKAAAQANVYVAALKQVTAGIGYATPRMGVQGAAGTAGIAPAPNGWYIYYSPAPGVITYEYTRLEPVVVGDQVYQQHQLQVRDREVVPSDVLIKVGIGTAIIILSGGKAAPLPVPP